MTGAMIADAYMNTVIIVVAGCIAYGAVKAVATLAALITWPALIAVVVVFVFLVVVSAG